jgi:hypothetical protein
MPMLGVQTSSYRQAVFVVLTIACLIVPGVVPAGAQIISPRDSAELTKPRYLPPPAPVTSGALYDELLHADHLLAEAMYGLYCSPKLLADLTIDDAEFYDDIVGFRTRAQQLAYQQYVSGSCQTERGVERTVLPGTFRAYPLGADIAMTTGLQLFRSRQNGRMATSQFTMIWRRRGTDDQWRASRMITFDDRAVTH